MHDRRKDSPSFRRNIAPLAAKFRELLGNEKLQVLEIGSGTGQHAVALAQEFPALVIQPTDAVAENLESIDAWIAETAVSNVKHARLLDVTSPGSFKDDPQKHDVILCFNVIHITPWEVTEALFEFASHTARPGGRLFLYGPFRIDGKQTSDSNEQFELWLKSKDEQFGVRDIAAVSTVADQNGFSLTALHPMPANNFLAEFTRA